MKKNKLAILLALLISVPIVFIFSSMSKPSTKTAAPAAKAVATAPVPLQTEEVLELTDEPIEPTGTQKATNAPIRFCVYRITAVLNPQPGNPLKVGSILCVYPCPPCSNPLLARVFRNGIFMCIIRAQLIATPCSTCPLGGFYGRLI